MEYILKTQDWHHFLCLPTAYLIYLNLKLPMNEVGLSWIDYMLKFGTAILFMTSNE